MSDLSQSDFEPMRFAYADPPYPGMAKKYYADHPDYAGEVDHPELIERLEAEYPDGWALSTASTTLRDVLELCPRPRANKHGRIGQNSLRIMAWCRSMTNVFGSVSVQYSWEPVIVRGGRLRLGRKPLVRDWVIANPPGYRGSLPTFTGGKPPEFCHWLFDVLGALPGDEFHDLFPGSGAVGRAWRAWSAATPEPGEQATLEVHSAA